MSRICVKNLPKYVAEDRLREFFSQKGEITDAKLMRTKDGKSRQFAFIGFRTEREAEEAINFFNKSYIDTCRITCEIARKIGDPNIPRPWSRHSLAKENKVTKIDAKGDEANTSNFSLDGNKRKANKKANENDDPLLQEFLQVMQPRVKSKLWENDLLIDQEANQNVEVGKKTQRMEGRSESSDSEMHVINENDNRSDNPCDLARDEVVSDMDYLKSRVKKDWSDSESNISSGDDEDDENDGSGDTSSESNEIKDTEEKDINKKHDEIDSYNLDDEVKDPSEDADGEILDHGNSDSVLKDENLESNRLFVRNLPFTATEDELQEHFSMFGDVSQVHLVVDRETKRSKGIAYIHYTLPESASRALEELDNTIFQGRLLHVMPAKQKHSSNKLETDICTSQPSKTFKQKKQEERKAAEASGDTKSWNTMFMRPDTVVEYMAIKLGVSKSDLLDREDVAVLTALGETQVIAETKKALAKSGVNIRCLEDFAAGNTHGLKRSNHVLLVKNLPYGSSEGELAKMFGKFGSLDKVILPPTKTLALVIFLEPSEAHAAFRGLAYKRYKDAPLYLEWAPADILDGNSSFKSEEKNNDVLSERFAHASLEGALDRDIDTDRIESRSLFVKNLNFKTSDESLKEHLSKHIKEGKILSVRIKKHLKNGKNVSMGFGFIEFDSVDTALNACNDLQGTVLDGHALILQLCHAKKEQVAKKVEKDKSSTKILVRNVAFEATKKDLRQLFSPFGQMKSLRLPMKFGNHRGFAFVEFVTKQEAQNALEALSNTHLYGRHLVLERAKEGETLEELRARTAAQFVDEQNGYQNSTKLSKKRKDVAVLDEGSMKFRRVEE